MTLNEFISTYTGKYVEVAGSANAKNQCVDLANAYIRDVLGLPIIEWTNAVDFPEKAGDKYDFFPNTPDGVPEIGDIVVFKKYGSLYGDPGHIGVIVYADVKTMKVFEQNYPTGSVCKTGTHNYLGCKGWLRAKKVENTQTLIDQLRAERDTNWNLYQKEREAKIDLEDSIDEMNKQKDKLSKDLSQKTSELEVLMRDKENLVTLNQELRNTLDSTKVELSVCEGLMNNRKTLDKYETGELIREIINRVFKRK